MDYSPVPVQRTASPGRIAVVTAGLIGGGAVAGAAAGVLGAMLWVTVADGLRSALSPLLWFYAGLYGAPLGAVLLPLVGFTALRRVPLGRLLATTIGATALGGALGALLPVPNPILGAVVGFFSATGWLWLRARRRVDSRDALPPGA